MEIRTIDRTYENKFVIEKSTFLSFFIPLSSNDEIKIILEEYKQKYHDATHICYGYMTCFDGLIDFKGYDDGEPSGSAGAPILNVLKYNNITNAIIIVVRYFGGVKLGASNLLRTYSNAAIDVFNKATIVTRLKCMHYKLTFKYNMIGIVDKVLSSIKAKILNKAFELDVTYEIVTINNNDINIIKEKIPLDLSYELIDEIYITI